MLVLLLGLSIFSCKKEKGETATLSGLEYAKFEQTDANGKVNKLYVIRNAAGMEVAITNMGARIVSILVPDKDGNMKNVMKGYDNIQPYLQLTDYKGAVLGRYAGRISEKGINIDRVKYTLRTNENKTMLNGGPRGFSTQYFTIEQNAANSLSCNYLSKHNEEGFPGNLDLQVAYTLTDSNELVIAYDAFTDRGTFANITNQMHFNLSGADAMSVTDQSLFVDALTYLETDENKIPTGKIIPVRGTEFDFTEARPVSSSYDLTLIWNKDDSAGDKLAAKLSSATTGINVEVYTTEPGVYLMTPDQSTVVLQTQHFPDSPNQEAFPSTVIRPDQPFKSRTIYKFGIEK
jgi:aldose 1-epimerase